VLDLKQQLCELQPDIVIFDLASTQPNSLIAMWKEQPHPADGVDQDKGSALMLLQPTCPADGRPMICCR